MSSPARGPTRTSHIKTPTRVRIRTYDEMGLTQREIVKKLIEERGVSVHQSTISRIIASKRSKRIKPKGKKCKLSERAVRYVTRLIRQGWFGRRMTYQRLIKQLDLKVSRWTLGRSLRFYGWKRCIACRRPFVSEKQTATRLDWARRYINWTVNAWATVIWSDEATFVTGERGRLYITRRVWEKSHPDCIQSVYRSGRTSFMVWGAIGWGWKSKLVFLERHHGKKGINSRDYAEQVLEVRYLISNISRFY